MGLILVLEHRFYGKSLPFANDSFKLENMKLLTSEQALSDLAYFIDQVNINNMYGVNKNPWITVGGSYPGAMSAWFRYKYPHLTVGAIASSAVVQAIEDFKDFDEQMYLSANKSGDYCWQAINSSNIKVESILASGQGAAFKKQFAGAENLKDDEFLFFWIDSIVGEIQYGKRTKLCDDLKSKSQDDQFTYFVNLAKGNDPYEYGSYYLKNETFALEVLLFYIKEWTRLTIMVLSKLH
jgi:pimeloyl-ACP methyl ester carboxylesterase